MDRTHRWAERSLAEHKKLESQKKMLSCDSHSNLNVVNESNIAYVAESTFSDSPQSLFGIVQGGRYKDLREESAKIIGAMDFDGFGIGGSFIKEDMNEAVRWVNEILPEDRPRHLLGVGEPEDLFSAVLNGCDLFDCVAPTRIARNGSLYTKNGKINIMNTKYRNDLSPIEEGCECYTCKNPVPYAAESSRSGFTRAYLAHLFHGKEILATTLASIHNLYFIINLVKDIRQSILDDNFFEFKETFLKTYKS